jgi:glycosyltransferase involved in cell wall biosynthesis
MRGRGEYSEYKKQRIFDFYGVQPIFDIHLISVGVTRGAQSILAIKTWGFLKRLSNKEILVYTRLLYGAVISVLLGYPVIYETHEMPQNGFRLFLERWLTKRVNLLKLVVISQALRDLYTSKVLDSFSKVPIRVAHDAADVPSYENLSVELEVQASRSAVLQLGYIGSLHEGRGIDIIMGMAKLTPECFYHIIGGRDEDIARCKRHGVKNVFFYSHVAPDLVKYYLREMDVLLMPYQKTVRIDSGSINTASWMSPMKMFEYMASQRPIISSDLPVLMKILSHGVNSLLVVPDDVDTWVKAVEKLKSSSLRHNLAQQAYLDLTRFYTWDIRVREVLNGV